MGGSEGIRKAKVFSRRLVIFLKLENDAYAADFVDNRSIRFGRNRKETSCVEGETQARFQIN